MIETPNKTKPSQTKAETLISVKDLKVHFPFGNIFQKRGVVRAVDGVSFDLPKGKTVGLVGESGSGKTTIGRALLRAVDTTEGEMRFYEEDDSFDIASLKGADLREYRKKAQLIFQDPYASLSPRMTVRDIIAEPLEALKITKGREETNEQVKAIAAKCRLNIEHLRRFPHAFSGGQRQRISIARALVLNPQFIVADESVAALDVSIQADIINLLKDLQREFGLTYLFISHDLSVVAHISDIVAVLYLGEIVELAPKRSLFLRPKHPYTTALLSAIPRLDDEGSEMQKLQGEIPSPSNPPSGCRFHTRCIYAESKCKAEKPLWREIESDHFVQCHFADSLELKGVF
ncbi:MAG: ATP-binding cassette domain-containing protein [Deinococcales bacterium]